MTKILITGATGFVGATLTRSLIEKGFEISITARRNSDYWRLDNYKDQLDNIFYIDLADRDAVFDMIKTIVPDVVFHVATYGGFASQQDKNLIIRTNIDGTINLLDACIENGVKRFINTGSSSEYGIKHEPMKETDNCEPVNLYGITKLAGTNYCSMIGKLKSYKVCTLRLFSPYGELEDSSRLFPSILKSLEKGEQPRLSKPDSVRDFIEIERVISVYHQMISADFEDGGIYNVGSGKQKSIQEFYWHVANSLGITNITPIWGEAASRAVEPRKWEADIKKLKALIDF